MQAIYWESWLLRLLLVGVLIFQLATKNTSGAIVAAEGTAVSLLPMLIWRRRRTPVPRALEFAFVFGMALQFGSESMKLFEVFYYWDKVVHPTLIVLTAMIAGWLLLGYREAYGLRIPTHFAALFGWLIGACVGAFWEFVEFFSDWFGNTELQKSNADTMTDMLSNDIGAFIAVLIGFWIYFHILGASQRRVMGEISHWLTAGINRPFQRRGRLVASMCALLVAGLLAATQWVDRDSALATGLPSGQSRAWSFTEKYAAPLTDSQVLLGSWQTDARAGACRVNLEDGAVPKPGSEKMGLLELAPGTAYGQNGQRFTVTTRVFEARPPMVEGTQMDGGIAFGIRDDKNFYLLEQSALHDILRLDHYIHRNRRDVREKQYRTHGEEWHTLQVTVEHDRVSASVDGEEMYVVTGLPETAGGIGLWGRTAAATCFEGAQVQVGGDAGIPVGLLIPRLSATTEAS
jgi:hypothetical protein